MSFGGAIGAMIASIKSNSRERKSALKKFKNHSFEKKGELYFENKASQKELAEIRNRIQKENKRKLRLYLSLFILFLIVIIFFFGFLKM